MRILLPIDDSDCSDVALETVIRQFQPQGAEVRVIHVDDWPRGMPASLAFSEGPAAADHILSIHDERRRHARTLMAGAVRKLNGAGFRGSCELRDGDARDGILDAAADWHPDVIVIGSHGRRGLQRFLLGSVAESVMRHARCSVEVVRADGSADQGA